MGYSHHYGPGPWVSKAPRADWTSLYYHRADSAGIGFDRTATGSNSVSQYSGPVQEQFGNLQNCPEKFLLWFHHLPWTYQMKSGKPLWDELCYRYYGGAAAVGSMLKTWGSVKSYVDPERHEHVSALLRVQEKEARWWRDACVLYFQTFSRKPIPAGLEKPAQSLGQLMKITHRYVPGN
jgi:alpha-glucuronidase